MSSSLIHLQGDKSERSLRSFYRKKEWTAVLTSHSIKIVAANSDRVLMSDTLLSLPALRAISVLHKSVRDNFDKIPKEMQPRSNNYYRYKHSQLGSARYKRVFEYDLNAAYLRAALALGLINQDLHDRIDALEKEERLAVLGSLATRKVFIDYREHEVHEKHSTRCPLFPAWDLIVGWVDAKMNDLYTGQKGSLFYWVDALFLDGPANIPDTKEKVVYYKTEGRFIVFKDKRRFPIINRKDAE